MLRLWGLLAARPHAAVLGWGAQTLPAGGMAVLAAAGVVRVANLISPVKRLGFCWEVFEVYFEFLPLSPCFLR